jgi:hypothetical protein
MRLGHDAAAVVLPVRGQMAHFVALCIARDASNSSWASFRSCRNPQGFRSEIPCPRQQFHRRRDRLLAPARQNRQSLVSASDKMAHCAAVFDVMGGYLERGRKTPTMAPSAETPIRPGAAPKCGCYIGPGRLECRCGRLAFAAGAVLAWTRGNLWKRDAPKQKRRLRNPVENCRDATLPHVGSN